MSVKEREEVFDLDFTYGDEYVHLHLGGRTLCDRHPAPSHLPHWRRLPVGEPVPAKCPCGAPVCPVCRHVHSERGR